MTRTRIRTLAGTLALLTAATLHADILVTRDGAKVETKGTWKVEGRRVIFTLPDGTLSSMRTEQVDLDASALATARAAEAAKQSAAPVAAPSGTPILRITEKDIPPMANPDLDEPESEASDSGDAGSSSPLEVVSWNQAPMQNGDGVQLYGTIRNNGTTNVISPSVLVALYDDDGKLIATADGAVNQSSIAPNQTANFRIEMPGVMSFAAAKFNLGGRGYDTRKPEGSEEAVGGAAYSQGSADEETAPAETAPPPAEEAQPPLA